MILRSGADLEERRIEYEREHLQDAVRRTDGNLTHAATLLGMGCRSLRYRANKLDLKETTRA